MAHFCHDMWYTQSTTIILSLAFNERDILWSPTAPPRPSCAIIAYTRSADLTVFKFGGSVGGGKTCNLFIFEGHGSKSMSHVPNCVKFDHLFFSVMSPFSKSNSSTMVWIGSLVRCPILCVRLCWYMQREIQSTHKRLSLIIIYRRVNLFHTIDRTAVFEKAKTYHGNK